MFEGKTAEGLAMANAAILIGFIEELIERRVMVRAHAGELLQETVNKLENCPTADWSNAMGASPSSAATAAANFRARA
jgi:hypothetical protein